MKQDKFAISNVLGFRYLSIPGVLLECSSHLVRHVIPNPSHGILANNKIWRNQAIGNGVIPVIMYRTSSWINFTYGMSIHVESLQKLVIWVIKANEVTDNRTGHWDHHLFIHLVFRGHLKNFKLSLQNPERPLHTSS